MPQHPAGHLTPHWMIRFEFRIVLSHGDGMGEIRAVNGAFHPNGNLMFSLRGLMKVYPLEGRLPMNQTNPPINRNIAFIATIKIRFPIYLTQERVELIVFSCC